MIIAIDFDGTCVTHEYPNIGRDIGAIPVLQELVAFGHGLVLFTMRSGLQLHEAVEWFKQNNIRLHYIQYNPQQMNWTSSNKCHADLYIDNRSIGCPLIHSTMEPPYANWESIRKILTITNVLPYG